MTPAKISDAFSMQSVACANLGSGFMGQLMRLCATCPWPDSTVTDRIFGWPGDITPAAQSVPLRLAGALHALHLRGHPILSDVYPPQSVSVETLWSAISATLVQDAPHIHQWLDSPPQTNEVRRSAVLIAVGHVLADRFGLPIRTSELGASGGLNLHWDSYGLKVDTQVFGATDPVLTLSPDWHGALPPSTSPKVVARAGVDLHPLDPSNPDHALRLQAYLWPDQPDRLALTRAAIAAARTSVDQDDAIAWLEPRLTAKGSTVHLIYSTVAWQYFPADRQALGETLIRKAGAKATGDAPLAWFGMENDGTGVGAALTLRLWPGDLTLDLGRADFHGRWVDWRGVA